MTVAGKLLANGSSPSRPSLSRQRIRGMAQGGTCSFDKTVTGWLIEGTLHRLSGRVGKMRNKKMIGAGLWGGRILIAYLASVKID